MQLIVIIMLSMLMILLYLVKTDKTLKRIAICYTIYMCIILIISMYNPNGLYAVSDYTYLLIMLSILFFVVPFICVGKKILKSEQNVEIDFEKVKRSKIIISVLLINLMIVIAYKIKYENIISNLPWYQIRLARYEKLFDSAFETLFFNYIITGIVSISCLLFVILLCNKQIKNIPFVLSGANVVVYSLIGYGRMMFFNMAIYFVINILLNKTLKDLLNVKTLIKALAIIAVLVAIFVGMMYPRTSNNKLSFEENMRKTIEDQMQQIIEYFVGGIRLLDKFIQEGFEEFNGYTYGRATLAGVDEIILYPIKGIGIEIDSFNNIIGPVTQKSVEIGENTKYFNAFYTCIMNFYLDFGIIGVIIYSILHAVLIVLVLNDYKKKKSLVSLILLNYTLLNLFFSIIRWNYQAGSSMFVLIILIMWNILENIKTKNSGKHGRKI